MKEKFKIVLKILLFFLPWCIGGFLFKYDPEFYNSLKIPSFALPGSAISIIWIILYVLIAISIYKIFKTGNLFKNNDYTYILVTNYLANQLFTFAFFTLKSPFLGFVMTTIVFISSIFLFIETKKIDKKSSYLLIPYIIYSSYAFLLSFLIYITNF